MSLLFPPPELAREAVGEKVDFLDLCAEAGIRARLTASALPEIRLHGGRGWLRVVDPLRPGMRTYCLSGPSLPACPQRRAAEILQRLAYQFHDWAAREVLASHRRFELRELPALLSGQGRLSPTAARVIAYLAQARGGTRAEIAEALRLAQPNLSRSLSELFRAALIEERDGEGAALLILSRAGRRLVAASLGRGVALCDHPPVTPDGEGARRSSRASPAPIPPRAAPGLRR